MAILAALRLSTSRLVAIAILAALWLAGCGLLDGAARPQDFDRRSLVVYEPDPGWEEAVLIDSVSWLPVFVGAGYDVNPGRTEGTFAARFVNLTGRRVQLRYELRFYDADAFLMDAFFPFGQPVLLERHETRWIRGDFTLDLSSDDALWLTTMELAARVTAPAP